MVGRMTGMVKKEEFRTGGKEVWIVGTGHGCVTTEVKWLHLE